jgi:hypothetical protein
MARCRARTENGTGPLCKNPVSEPGMRCHHHVGLPEAPSRLPRPRSQRTPRTRDSASYDPASPQRRQSVGQAERAELRRQERVRKVSEYCADVVGSGSWADTVAERATDYVSEKTWQRLIRGRRGRQCRALARTAEGVLTGKRDIHNMLGIIASRSVRLLGGSDAAQDFTNELVSALPIPVLDAKLVAAARGIQVTGVLICVVRGRELTKCDCFIALALAETKAQVRKLLVAAMTDWTKLQMFRPKSAAKRP